MFILKMTSQFKKDLKRIQNQPIKIQHLKQVLLKLEENGVIPNEYRPHKLSGNYAELF